MADEDEISTELASIQETISSDPRAYWRDPELQQRHLDLHEAQISGKPVPAKPTGLQAEKARIEKAMKEDGGREYWRSPEMQNRYRAILELEESQPAQAVERHAAPEFSGDIMQGVRANVAQSPEGRQWLREMGSQSWQLELASEKSDEILMNLSEVFGDAAAEVDEAFAGLSSGTQIGVLREFAAPMPPARRADADEMELFMESEGEVLAEIWGSEAPAKVGLVLSRWERLLDSLPEHQADELLDFVQNRLDLSERALILYTLAG